MNQRDVLLVGDTRAPEFAPALQWLHENMLVHAVLDPQQALAWLSQRTAANHLIVVALGRPDAIGERAIRQLQAAAPDARLVCLLGTWCEGTLRSTTTNDNVTRVYWHQFCARANRNWLAPADEAIEDLTSLANRESNRTIAIHTTSLLTYQCLADACRPAGWSTLWLTPHDSPNLDDVKILLWDMEEGRSCEVERWRATRARLRHAANVLLIGFPRLDDVRQLLAGGADAVLAKPLLIADLLSVLQRNVEPRFGSREQRRAG